MSFVYVMGMISETPVPYRNLKTIKIEADLVVVGGGLAGVCGALTAARAGCKVVLMHDRPVLGGNASSEVRLWVLGATAHGGCNNRWAREGGVINEILIENFFRNPEGNPLIFDTVLLEYVANEPNITLLLNTPAGELGKTKADPDRIAWVRGFNAQNSTLYECHAPLFCDSSGDGIIGFLSGAAFRMGAESKEEFGEQNAPVGEFGYLLGHSIYFYSKNVGKSVKFIPPAYALKNVPERIPRYRCFNAHEQGCQLWWIEWGGRLDTVHNTEEIKWELWKVVYGVWDYIKNSGRFPEAENLTLEWVGQVPGKRESRRFEGPYMLRQQDVMERRQFEDAVAFGGWSIDLHPADGVYSPLAGSKNLHSRGLYTIPYRCFYSRNVKNLFFSGRIISSTHVAYGTTRVMATCAHGGQAVGMAATLCKRWNCLPADMGQPGKITVLQQELLRTGQHIPGLTLNDSEDLARQATITSSSRLLLQELPDGGPRLHLLRSTAQMIPASAGVFPKITLTVDCMADTQLVAELRTTSDLRHHTPDVTLACKTVTLSAGGGQKIDLDFGITVDQPRYVFLCLMANERVFVHTSEKRVTGLLTAEYVYQERTRDSGGDDFEIWRPVRRPGGHNFAFQLTPAIDVFGLSNVINGIQRPTHQPNAWAADFADPHPTFTLAWNQPQTIGRMELFFDVDYEHTMESVQWGHPERVIPFCVKHFRILNEHGTVLTEVTDNHQVRCVIPFASPVTTARLTVEVLAVHGLHSPAAIFEVRCYR